VNLSAPLTSHRRETLSLLAAALLLLAGIALEGFVHTSGDVGSAFLLSALAVATFGCGWRLGAVWLAAARSRAELEAEVAERTADLSQIIDTLQEQVRLRSAAELALRSSEERYRSIFDQAQDIIFTLSFDGRISSLSPSFERLTGWSAGDWIGKPFLGLLAPEDQLRVEQLFARALTKTDLTTASGKLITRAGGEITVEASVVRQILNGEPVGFLGFARDVTERLRASERLQRSESLLAESQQIAKLGSWEVDLTTNAGWWSDEQYRIFGLERGEVLPSLETIVGFLRQSDREAMPGIQETILATGSNDWEMTARLADGTEKVLSVSGRLTESGEGSRRISGTTQDITERRHAEEQLRGSEERFRLMARAANDAIWDWDLVTGDVWWGNGFSSLFGYTEANRVEDIASWSDRIHPEDRGRVETGIYTAIDSGQTGWSDEYRFRRADGTYATILDRGLIVRDAGKRPVRMVGAMMDMTERKHLQEQLAQARRVSSLGRVAASIAHEFNNVLMGVQPNLEIIRRRASADLQAPLEHILRSVQRGKRVTEEILQFTRRVEPSLQCVGVADFLSRWEEEIRPVVGHSLSLEIEADQDLYMSADALQLAQVFTNLAVNARDAMAEGGTLHVSGGLATSFSRFPFGTLPTADRYVHFAMHDTGCGMTPEQLTHVFEPLFTTKKGGTGLGLAISYQVVLQHDGHMFVDSEAGCGTTFHLFIPATSPALAELAEEKPSELGMRRILIVEDEVAVAFGLKALLEVERVEVHVVHSGGEALPAIERLRPDCVILDIGLPDIDGIEVYRRIDLEWPELPTLFSSGHASEAKLEQYLQKPNVALLMKPYDFHALKTALLALAGTGRSVTA
jgi:PAS domain S-box-containing protein